ncbi:HNH endonuclease [Arthrobacter jiangjiafuii]|uniref:HNH endonuclease n=1 Tax=Arthrobacter jiangjiafuii TaxID=2817475 RepID=A0A975R054_9MICC|nr:HNH endonuclease [Arthrobacter jiangjiafuii]MBP3045104.1 HNH endonuclease [Arthrobacter jiangjiafuii]QWC10580.1 HNH endonuclease [Arthrobacter jiangjiafuii]
MSAVVMGWNPVTAFGAGPGRTDYRAAALTVYRTGLFGTRWRVSRGQQLDPGTDVWLFAQGQHGRGLLGHGVVAAAPQPGPALPARLGLLAGIVFDLLLPPGEALPAEELEIRVPEVNWNAVRSTGTGVPGTAEGALRAAWTAFLHTSPAPEYDLGVADPTVPLPGSLPQDSLRHVAVSRYEYDADALRQCVAFHGLRCAACGLSMEQIYGPAGAAFIQVHHIVPPAAIGPDYTLDPVADLVPLCPNCHAMAHRGAPDAFTPAELRRMLAEAAGPLPSANSISGSVFTAEEAGAHDDAARLKNMQQDRDTQ